MTEDEKPEKRDEMKLLELTLAGLRAHESKRKQWYLQEILKIILPKNIPYPIKHFIDSSFDEGAET